ncbi:MAG TPA: hypothetical protein VK762_10425, partial [Polyangiaceae bacterium]|nr:hypothetical protein [Polyangiaceae bacterium]
SSRTDGRPESDAPGNDDGGESDGGSPGDSGCSNDCPSTTGSCIDYTSDNANCGGCGAACATGETCVGSMCTGGPTGEGGVLNCPDGGCPISVGNGFTCPFGSCNGASSTCTSPGGCFCSNDTQCLSGKCVKIAGENDVSCGTHCSGTGGRDGFDCELASPGIPALTASGFACPANSGFKTTTLSCDPTHTNCYCTADNQCPNGKCVPSSNNGNCSGCSGSGSADFRGCQAIATLPGCPIYIGCPSNSQCSYPNCQCTSDVACASGHCICNGSSCTGKSSNPNDGHGCEKAPSSVACTGSGGTSCTTTLSPTPVLNAAHSACLCVADSNCSSGKCVNADTQCTGTCTGASPADNQDCRTAESVASSWSCPVGNCNTATSPTDTCAAAGVPCWCTTDSQCPAGATCATWAGCTAGACTGAGTGNAFHCVQ